MSVKKLVQVFLSAFLLIAISGCSRALNDDGLPAKIRMAVIRVPNDQTVALESNFFKDYFEAKGVEVEVLFFDSGVGANQAFLSGSIDFAEMGHTNTVVALAAELPVELIWLHEILGTNEALVARTDKGIESVNDLKGKKIATSFGSTSHYSLLKTLEMYDLVNDVILLDMQTSEIVAAWDRGDIDAAYTWEPALSKMKAEGVVLIDSEQLSKQGVKTANAQLVHSGFAKKYPELVVEYVRALDTAVSLYQDDVEKAEVLASKHLGLSIDEVKNQMHGSQWLSAKDQLSQAYLGSTQQRGDFANVVAETALFLNQYDYINKIPSQQEIDEFINPQYVEQIGKWSDE